MSFPLEPAMRKLAVVVAVGQVQADSLIYPREEDREVAVAVAAAMALVGILERREDKRR
jgi:hypothetical protein